MKKFLYILLAMVALLVIIMLAMGKKYHFEKSIVINAPVERVYSHISSMKAFNEWNPWMDLDKNLKVTYSGTSGAVGDKYCWEGNKDVGKGCHEITGLQVNKKQANLMHFKEPFESDATGNIYLEAQGNSTKVTWDMDCELDYPMNLMKLMMDSQMDDSYGKGLNKLKALAEK